MRRLHGFLAALAAGLVLAVVLAVPASDAPASSGDEARADAVWEAAAPGHADRDDCDTDGTPTHSADCAAHAAPPAFALDAASSPDTGPAVPQDRVPPWDSALADHQSPPAFKPPIA